MSPFFGGQLHFRLYENIAISSVLTVISTLFEINTIYITTGDKAQKLQSFKLSKKLSSSQCKIGEKLLELFLKRFVNSFKNSKHKAKALIGSSFSNRLIITFFQVIIINGQVYCILFAVLCLLQLINFLIRPRVCPMVHARRQ